MNTSVDSPPASLTLSRHFSNADRHPYKEIEWALRSAEISDAEGKTIFKQESVEVPAKFSELATRILGSKYLYGDPQGGNNPLEGGREQSFKQVLDRVCGTITEWGLEDGYFTNPEDATVFREELTWLCLNQYAAFNSPVWFNLGLHQAYGVGTDSKSNNFYWDSSSETVQPTQNQYEHPQCSACFIQGVEDSLDSIMELAVSEAKLFKFGSGSGSDLSNIRSTREKLSGGGKPSGPLSFLKVFDSVAGVVKSGGKTRRAAKMNTLKDWHPDIEEFIQAKRDEELKAWALIEEGYSASFNGEAYESVRFQNANLSIRASDEFMKAAVEDHEWWTRRVTDGRKCEKKSAKALLKLIAECTHVCGDPGLQFDDTIHQWHTCKASGRQNCSNPCSEYLFLDDSACNLASLNLIKFSREGEFDFNAFSAACRILVIAQEIIVDRSSYPTPAIALNTHRYRPLGLGFSNLGGMLLHHGIAYNSNQGRNLAGAISALMTGIAYKTSTELAQIKGPFPGYRSPNSKPSGESEYESNEQSMLEVIDMHCDQVAKLSDTLPPDLINFTQSVWADVREKGHQFGFRNAQVTALAPTGTIGLLMDCDTTGIEPALALVTYKELAGGGHLTLPVQGVKSALEHLGYSADAIEAIEEHIRHFGTVESVSKNGKRVQTPLQEKDLSVFDTSFRNGEGKRALSPEAHIRMMASVQPFISGAISKTVNMPSEAKVEDILNIYIESWKMGLKGVAIYRDGSKRSAPLKSKSSGNDTEKASVQMTTEPIRRRLPVTRNSKTHKFHLGGSDGYFTVGEYEDGSPGEIFIQMAKAGSTINGLMDSIAILISLSLQHGVPLETLVNKFSHVRFEPEGITRNPEIPFSKSVMDYLARWLGIYYIPGYRERVSPVTVAPGDANVHKPDAPINQPQPQLELITVFEGDNTCPECGSNKVKITGSCACCTNCGTSLGCS